MRNVADQDFPTVLAHWTQVPKHFFKDGTLAPFATPELQLSSLREAVLKLATSQDKLLRDPAALLAHTLDPPELQTVDEALQCSPRGRR